MFSNTESIANYLGNLQDEICQKFCELDGGQFKQDKWKHGEQNQQINSGGGISRIFENTSDSGKIIAKAGVNFSHIYGSQLPDSATQSRPELTGRQFQALGVSVVVHPLNPYVPTVHANVRFFVAEKPKCQPIWWFGGGIDLTPYYGFDEDCIEWHRVARSACQPFETDGSDSLYRQLKQQCDDYFYLPHRREPRGIGGLFFDDFNHLGFEKSFAFMRSVGDHFIKGYLPIVNRRKDIAYGKRELDFQQYRRGRYVEFNLLHDRGTLFGIQSGGRTESILMSLPPLVQWKYNWAPELGSKEDELLNRYLIKDKQWL